MAALGHTRHGNRKPLPLPAELSARANELQAIVAVGSIDEEDARLRMAMASLAAFKHCMAELLARHLITRTPAGNVYLLRPARQKNPRA